MELEEAIKNVRKFNQENRYRDCRKINNSIDMVLQALEELQQKEKSRIIGNINEIKIEDLGSVLKPYYIPKEKVINKLNEIEEMIYKTTKGELQKYTVGELIFQRTIYNRLLEE